MPTGQSQISEYLIHLIERLWERLMQTQHLIFRSWSYSWRRWACRNAIEMQKCYRNADITMKMLLKCRNASLSKGEEEKGDERKGPGPGNWVLFWSDLKPLEGWQPEYMLLREGWDCWQVDRKWCWMSRVDRLIIQDLNIMRLAILWRTGLQRVFWCSTKQKRPRRGVTSAQTQAASEPGCQLSHIMPRKKKKYYAKKTSSSTIQEAPLFFSGYVIPKGTLRTVFWSIKIFWPLLVDASAFVTKIVRDGLIKKNKFSKEASFLHVLFLFLIKFLWASRAGNALSSISSWEYLNNFNTTSNITFYR